MFESILSDLLQGLLLFSQKVNVFFFSFLPKLARVLSVKLSQPPANINQDTQNQKNRLVFHACRERYRCASGMQTYSDSQHQNPNICFMQVDCFSPVQKSNMLTNSIINTMKKKIKNIG